MKCFMFFSFIIFASSALECPSSKWFRFKNKCYLVDRSKMYTFQQNVDFCKSQNATTASIHSEEENHFIKTKLYSLYGLWIGIKQIDFDKKTFEWLDGSSYNYSNWDWRIKKTNCPGARVDYGKWYEYIDCNGKSGALCQIDLDSPSKKVQS